MTLKTYIGTKSLKARAMTLGEYNAYRGWTQPADENPEAPGYLVEYLDGGAPNHASHRGYISWSPAEVFERTYRLKDAMTFGEAVECLKQGKRIWRRSWPNQFVYLVPPASYPVQTGAAKAHFGEGALVPYQAYLAEKTRMGTVATWQPRAEDVLAEDWGIYE